MKSFTKKYFPLERGWYHSPESGRSLPLSWLQGDLLSRWDTLSGTDGIFFLAPPGVLLTTWGLGSREPLDLGEYLKGNSFATFGLNCSVVLIVTY